MFEKLNVNFQLLPRFVLSSSALPSKLKVYFEQFLGQLPINYLLSFKKTLHHRCVRKLSQAKTIIDDLVEVFFHSFEIPLSITPFLA